MKTRLIIYTIAVMLLFTYTTSNLKATDQNKSAKIKIASELIKKNIFRHRDHITFSAITNDLESVVTGSEDRFVSMWNTNNGKKIVSRKRHTDMLTRLTFSPNDKYLATADGPLDNTSAGYLIIWKTKSLKLLHKIKADGLDVRALSFSPNGEQLATYGLEDGMKIWAVKTGKLIVKSNNRFHNQILSGRLTRRSANTLIYTKDGKHIVSCGDDKKIIIWNTKDLSIKKTIAFKDTPFCLDLSKSGTKIACGDLAGNIHIIDTITWKKIKHYNSLSYGILAIKFCNDDKLIIAGGHDKSLKILETLSGKEVHTLPIDEPSITSIKISKDNSRLVAVTSHSKKRGHNGNIYYWHLDF